MDIDETQDLEQFEGLIDGLLSQEYGCCDDFLSPLIVTGLNTNLQELNDAGKLKESGIGNQYNYQQDKRIRNDQIHWLNELSTNEFEVLFLKKVDKFMHYLNSTCFTALNSFESHYASYGQHSFYKRHLDQFKSEKGRQFSLILYLNENWTAEDGGLLSLYPKAKNQLDISPMGGRLVFFRSDNMEHEVHPSTTKERRSIAGWMK